MMKRGELFVIGFKLVYSIRWNTIKLSLIYRQNNIFELSQFGIVLSRFGAQEKNDLNLTRVNIWIRIFVVFSIIVSNKGDSNHL